jgi:PhnB protein
MAVKPIPDGYHSVTPYLVVRDVAGLIDFLKAVFGATELLRTSAGGGGIHAEVKIGDSIVMMGEGPGHEPMPAMLHLYVEDTDAAYQRALRAGATSQEAPNNTFYGDRRAGVLDPFGNRWYIATHIEDVRPEEIAARAEAVTKGRR